MRIGHMTNACKNTIRAYQPNAEDRRKEGKARGSSHIKSDPLQQKEKSEIREFGRHAMYKLGLGAYIQTGTGHKALFFCELIIRLAALLCLSLRCAHSQLLLHSCCSTFLCAAISCEFCSYAFCFFSKPTRAVSQRSLAPFSALCSFSRVAISRR